jgi:hypothetical protein
VTRSILEQLGAGGTQLASAAIAALGIYLAVIVATRVSGLRSFTKMSAFDFAMTVAIGSLIAAARLTLETTGEVSVLRGDEELDPALLRGVRRTPLRSGGGR